MTDPVTQVEERGSAAYSKPEGPDYAAILVEVSQEHGMTVEDLKEACLERWIVAASA